MITRHFDVIVLGRSVGALTAAALLARRQVRVLVLGQGEKSPFYSLEGYPMARRLDTTLAASSPIFSRILQELAQSQRFRQISESPAARYAYLSHATRFHGCQNEEDFRAEVEREFPELSIVMGEFQASCTAENQLIDQLFAREVVFPPGSVMERLEANPLSAQLPYFDKKGSERILPLSRFSESPELSEFLRLVTHFSTNLGGHPDEVENPLAIVRQFGNWSERLRRLKLPQVSLERFLLERIEAHGGSCRLDSFASELFISRGRITGARIDDEEEWTGAEAIVTNLTGEAIAELSSGEGLSRKAREQWPHVYACAGRMIVNVLVSDRGLPEALPQESFLAAPLSHLPALRLQKLPLSKLQSDESRLQDADKFEGKTLLVAELTFDQRAGAHLLDRRAATLEVLERYFPFVLEHLICVDSPHDGLPAWVYEPDENGKLRKREVERIFFDHRVMGAEPMLPRFEIEPLSFGGLAGEPLRGPIAGSYLVGPSVLPGLGQEGEMIAAWSVARILTRKDGSRQKLRRQMWRRIET